MALSLEASARREDDLPLLLPLCCLAAICGWFFRAHLSHRRIFD